MSPKSLQKNRSFSRGSVSGGDDLPTAAFPLAFLSLVGEPQSLYSIVPGKLRPACRRPTRDRRYEIVARRTKTEAALNHCGTVEDLDRSSPRPAGPTCSVAAFPSARRKRAWRWARASAGPASDQSRFIVLDRPLARSTA